jgi:hypothetical protein
MLQKYFQTTYNLTPLNLSEFVITLEELRMMIANCLITSFLAITQTFLSLICAREIDRSTLAKARDY